MASNHYAPFCWHTALTTGATATTIGVSVVKLRSRSSSHGLSNQREPPFVTVVALSVGHLKPCYNVGVRRQTSGFVSVLAL